MCGRNGGAMEKSNSGSVRGGKRNKVVTMPLKKGGEDSAAPRGSNAEGTGAKKNDREKAKGARKGLRQAVKEAVNGDRDKLADSLVRHAENGDVRCAALVMDLMEKQKEGDGDNDFDEPSLAERLAAEPSWDDVVEAKRKLREIEAEKVPA